MAKACQILYSHFSIHSVFTLRERSLLLQFLLFALNRGAKEELIEHASLLHIAFPELCCDTLKKNLLKLTRRDKILSSQKKAIYSALTPFLHACKEEESLILFLLRHHKEYKKHLDLSVLLHSWHSNDWEKFISSIQSKWQARGFSSLSQEVAVLSKSL